MDKASLENEIRRVLRDYNPSELDEAAKNVCPFYEPGDRDFTSVYLEFHELAKAGLLTELQSELQGLQVVSEKELDSGRVDGSVYEPDINGSKILLLSENEESLCLAHLEVKTGKNVKLLQSAAYAFQDEIPVILAEVSKSEVHLLDYETSVRLLEFAKNQLDRLDQLKEMKKRIPDGYRCSSCGNEECQYWAERIRQKSHSLVEKRASQLLGKNGEVVDEIVEVIQELARRRGLETEMERGEEIEP